MRPWTIERIAKLTPEQRGTLRANALRMGGEAGEAVVQLIDASGLPWMVHTSDPAGDAVDAAANADALPAGA